ncbi:unnamed protein product [Amoebophrya sp. A25]|nr:unnamed protein product [Amoebophrya sp. A25]|eukprot:GSA25T00018893001.1
MLRGSLLTLIPLENAAHQSQTFRQDDTSVVGHIGLAPSIRQQHGATSVVAKTAEASTGRGRASGSSQLATEEIHQKTWTWTRSSHGNNQTACQWRRRERSRQICNSCSRRT